MAATTAARGRAGEEYRELMSGLFRRRNVIHFALALATGGGVVCAQAQQKQGLDALSDDAVMTELANRGLDQLLQRVFEQNNVPQSEREGRMTLIALRRLSDPEARLSETERERLVREIVTGIEAALPKLNDPRLLLQQASVLIQQGIEGNINTLEFWGENPRLQATLRPIADTTRKILDRTIEVTQENLDTIVNDIRTPGDAASKRYEQMEAFLIGAQFTRDMSEYYRVMARDRSSEERKQIATEAIEALQEHDNAESTVQPVVKNRIAKLLLARGNDGDYAEARKLLSDVIEGRTEPKADLAGQYEALYFSAVADLQAKKLEEARQGLVRLRAWQEANVPEANRAGVDAAASMLEYRIVAARAESASGQEKQQLNAQAIDILTSLVRQQPALRTIVYQQLLDRLPSNADVASLDSLLLRALMGQGERESRKSGDEPKDQAIITRSIAASEEFIRRGGSGRENITQDELATAMLLKGVLYHAASKPIEAADAFMDFVAKFKGHANSAFALENALALVGAQLEQREENPRIDEQYTRVLGLAVGEPFNRVDLAYYYGRQLQQKGKFKEAAEALAKVPEDAPNKLYARYFQMISLKQHLDENRTRLPEAEQAAVLEQVQALAQQVRQQSSAASIGTSSEQERARLKQLLVQTTLMSADLANRVQRQPQRALEILSGFEQEVAGMAREQQLLGDALFVRVDAYMDLKQNTKATEALINLLNTRGGGEGAQIIYDLLQRLNSDFEQARRQGDKAEMQSLASARAELTGYLVKWAAENSDPKIRDFTYRYRVFDADSQRQAAALTDDPAERTRLLNIARERYEALRSPEGRQQYQATIKGTDVDPTAPDPVVAFGLAQVAYDQGDYRTAQGLLTRLIQDRRLGPPRIYRGEGEQRELVDNEQYWEALYKLYRSNLEVAKADPAFANLAPDTKRALAQLYIMQGDTVGGQKWGPEFDQLRQELQIPASGAAPAAGDPAE